VRTPHDEVQAKASRRTRFGCGGVHEISLGRPEGGFRGLSPQNLRRGRELP